MDDVFVLMKVLEGRKNLPDNILDFRARRSASLQIGLQILAVSERHDDMNLTEDIILEYICGSYDVWVAQILCQVVFRTDGCSLLFIICPRQLYRKLLVRLAPGEAHEHC